jgi:formamidopyrimidine-DNA glycosylase
MRDNPAMPELPEVETVRRGLELTVAGRTIATVDITHPRAIRRHVTGAEDFAGKLVGRTIVGASRRGKFLWLPLDSDDALLAHLGMSGQMLVVPADKPDETHLRVRIAFTDGGSQLRFVDQRTFGYLAVAEGGAQLPALVAHIARDPIDPEFDEAAFIAAVRRRRTGLKRAILDQTIISGVGNIYADEALWRARLHWARPTERTTPAELRRLLVAIREVLQEAISAGGTSFDALYVNIDGESGYFERALAVYGRAHEPCSRCGTPIRRDKWMNRSAFSCPRCQPRPRQPHL